MLLVREIPWSFYSQSFPKLLQPCTKLQQSCASQCCQSHKDHSMQCGLSCQDTTEFPLYLSQTMLPRPPSSAQYPSEIQEIAIIFISQKSCSDRSSNFWYINRCALILTGSLGQGTRSLSAYMTVHQNVERESDDWTSNHRLSWLYFPAYC